MELSLSFKENNPMLWQEVGASAISQIQIPEPKNLQKVSDPYLGSLDLVDSSRIAGWAMDKSNRKKRLTIDIYDGKIWLARAPANQYRQDLLDAKLGDGRYSFTIPLPTILYEQGAHRVHAIIADTNQELLNSPKRFSEDKMSN